MQRVTEQEIEKIIKMRLENYSREQIATEVGRTISSVSHILYNNGIHLDMKADFDDTILLQQKEIANSLGTQKVGRITELDVTSELLRMGFDIFIPSEKNSKVDLILINNSLVANIQIKTGMYSEERKCFRANLRSTNSNGERITYKEYKEEDVDFFIVKCWYSEDFYVIPREAGNGKDIFLYPNRTPRFSKKDINFENYLGAFHLIKEKLKLTMGDI